MERDVIGQARGRGEGEDVKVEAVADEEDVKRLASPAGDDLLAAWPAEANHERISIDERGAHVMQRGRKESAGQRFLHVPWTRVAIAFCIIMLGRVVLTIEGRGTFLPDLSRCWKEGCF